MLLVRIRLDRQARPANNQRPEVMRPHTVTRYGIIAALLVGIPLLMAVAVRELVYTAPETDLVTTAARRGRPAEPTAEIRALGNRINIKKSISVPDVRAIRNESGALRDDITAQTDTAVDVPAQSDRPSEQFLHSRREDGQHAE